MFQIIFSLPLRIVSAANRREHWAIRAKRIRQHRQMARHFLKQHLPKMAYSSVETHLTRQGKRLLDSDNLAYAFKGIRDGIADGLGLDDGSEACAWFYHQEKASGYGVLVEIILR